MRSLTLVVIGLAVASCAAPWSGTLFQGGLELRAQEADPARPAETPAPRTSADPSEETAAPADDAIRVKALRRLDAAAAKITEHDSIRAELLETVSIGDRRFKVTGKYIAGKNHKLALRYRVLLGESEGIYEEICDGDVLFTVNQIKSAGPEAADKAAEKPNITRQDIKQVLAAVRDYGETPHNLAVLELGLGGLPALLGAVTQRIEFDDIREATIDGMEFTVLSGGWTPEFLKVLHGRGNAKLDDAALAELAKQPLPEHVPDRMRLFLDSRDFPRRIQYLKRPGGDGPLTPMVTLDFVEVILNDVVDDSEFRFEPPDGVYVNDITPQRLAELRRAATPATPARPAPAPPE
ncbi:MAG: hypothetical protein WD066_20265 [Planctomycetaceae bacterium]